MGALAEVPTIVKYLHTFLDEWNNMKENNLKNEGTSTDNVSQEQNQITTSVDRLKIKNRMPSSLSNSYLNEI